MLHDPYTESQHPPFIERPAHTEDTDMTLASTTTSTRSAASSPSDHGAIEIAGRLGPRYDEILTPEALTFLVELHHRFASRRHDRLADRMRRRFEVGKGHDPQFRGDNRHPDDAERRVAGAFRDSRTAASRSTGPPTRR